MSIERAARARELVNNPLFQEIMKEVREEFIELSLNAETVDAREAARASVRGLEAIREKFDEIEGDGEQARVVAKPIGKRPRRR